MNFRECKRIIRVWLSRTDVWTEEKLCHLLAHARAEKLSYYSCCCLRGFPSANHAYQSSGYDLVSEHSSWISKELLEVDSAFNCIWHDLNHDTSPSNLDAQRRRILIPMILAELKRRSHLEGENTVTLKGYRERQEHLQIRQEVSK